jgi:flagellar FliL protein
MPTREPQRKIETAPATARASAFGATWLVLLAAFALGAAGGFVGGRASALLAPAGAQRGAATQIPDGVASDDTLPDRMLALDPFVVNLLGDDAGHYLKVKLELEAKSAEHKAELARRLPQIRDGVISVLSTRDLAAVTSFEGKTLLKQDIQDGLNGLLPTPAVRSVLFTEFVVQ